MAKQSSELAAACEAVENQSTLMVTALTTSLAGALKGIWRSSNDASDGDANNTNDGNTNNANANDGNTNDGNTMESEKITRAAESDEFPKPVAGAPASPSSSRNEPTADVAIAFIQSLQGIIHSAERSGERDKLCQLSWTHQTVKDTILVLVNEKRLYTKKKLYDVEPASLDPKNRGHYWACMELVEQVITDEQRFLLQLNQKEQEKIENFDDVLKITAYTIEDEAFQKMKELDQKTTSLACPTISGLGNRYKQCCETHGIERIKTSHKTHSAVAPAAGSIRSFFSTVKNALSPGRSNRS